MEAVRPGYHGESRPDLPNWMTLLLTRPAVKCQSNARGAENSEGGAVELTSEAVAVARHSVVVAAGALTLASVKFHN